MASNTAIDPEALFGEVREKWGWLLALGIASLILGTIGIGSCFALTLAGVVLFGWLIVIELIANGWTMVTLALAARAAGTHPQVEQPA